MRKLIASMALATAVAVAVAAIAIAAGEGPTSLHNDGLVRVAGNPTCLDGGTGLFAGFKVEPVANGMYDADGNLTTDNTKGIVVISGFNGKLLNWAFTSVGRGTYEIDSVIVKGGPNANVYTYTHVLDNSDEGLHPPLNPNGNTQNGTKVYGFSHVDFCFDNKVSPA